MRLQTELDAIKILPLFQDFEALVGARHWERMVEQVGADIRGRPHLRRYLEHRHRIAFALHHLHGEYREGRHVRISEHPAFYEAAALAMQFTDIAKAYPGIGHALVRRLHGALSRAEHMRGLQFELEVATQLARRGLALTFPDLDGAGRFDFLAVKDGGQPIEVECKYITHDKGRRVTRYAAHLIHHALKDVVGNYAKQVRRGVILRVIFDNRAPEADIDIQNLVAPVCEALHGQAQAAFPSGRIEVIPFDIEDSPFSHQWPSVEQVVTFLGAHGIINVEFAVHAFPNGGAVTVTLESDRRATVLDAVFDTAKEATTKQLTGERPSVLCIKFEGVSPEALADIGAEAEGTPSALRIRASAFLHSSSSRRMSLLSFFSDAQELTTRGDITTREGVTYSFKNSCNEFHANETLARLFGLEHDA